MANKKNSTNAINNQQPAEAATPEKKGKASRLPQEPTWEEAAQAKPPAVLPSPTEGTVLVDALSHWKGDDIETTPTTLRLARLNANMQWFVPFTTTVARCRVHYLEYPSVRGYVRCNGPGCVVCRIGRQCDERDLWPVYDALDGAVVVMAVSPSMRPQALRPRLLPVMHRIQKAAGPLVIGVRQVDREHAVVVNDLPVGADDGADAVRVFKAALDAGRIDLRSAYLTVPNEVLESVPEVRTALTLIGGGPT